MVQCETTKVNILWCACSSPQILKIDRPPWRHAFCYCQCEVRDPAHGWNVGSNKSVCRSTPRWATQRSPRAQLSLRWYFRFRSTLTRPKMLWWQSFYLRPIFCFVRFIAISCFVHCWWDLKCSDGTVFTCFPAHAEVRFIAIWGFLKSHLKPSNALLWQLLHTILHMRRWEPLRFEVSFTFEETSNRT